MDRMYWWPSKDDKYSVSTGYWLGRLGQHGSCNQAPTSSIAERLTWVADKVDKIELRLFSCFMWAAWSCRNSAVFENNPPKSIQKLVGELQSPGLLKVNTDAHVGNEPCPYAGLGVVIRDDRGVVLGIASGAQFSLQTWFADRFVQRLSQFRWSLLLLDWRSEPVFSALLAILTCAAHCFSIDYLLICLWLVCLGSVGESFLRSRLGQKMMLLMLTTRGAVQEQVGLHSLPLSVLQVIRATWYAQLGLGDGSSSPASLLSTTLDSLLVASVFSSSQEHNSCCRLGVVNYFLLIVSLSITNLYVFGWCISAEDDVVDKISCSLSEMLTTMVQSGGSWVSGCFVLFHMLSAIASCSLQEKMPWAFDLKLVRIKLQCK
ncbi:hypothetical protein POM88_037516 [Heracleum sosnowskyi]|uniref:RNase H type-1 domain-containing protein n=1 Tax=Heracleum sosnowskyi TaxID=360622 RepID=A0AAD8HQA6_9APIA|nr:hypothetical protein POM88_037516 [Heracleum sosnowskyi]